jgi:hypothetical protein
LIGIVDAAFCCWGLISEACPVTGEKEWRVLPITHQAMGQGKIAA